MHTIVFSFIQGCVCVSATTSDGRPAASTARRPVAEYIPPREPTQRDKSLQRRPPCQGTVGQQGGVPPGRGGSDHRPGQRLEVPLSLLQERRR